jgi:hypothetical protein
MNEKLAQAVATPPPSFTFSVNVVDRPAFCAGKGRSDVVTAIPAPDSVRHLVSNKPLFRPKRHR